VCTACATAVSLHAASQVENRSRASLLLLYNQFAVPNRKKTVHASPSHRSRDSSGRGDFFRFILSLVYFFPFFSISSTLLYDILLNANSLLTDSHVQCVYPITPLNRHVLPFPPFIMLARIISSFRWCNGSRRLLINII